jgi:hypothetical protein
MKRAQLLAVALLVAAVVPVLAAELHIETVALTSPAAPFTDARLQIQTSPGASCAITVHYKSGPSRAKGLSPQTADAKGRIIWVWRVGSNTTPGVWPIIVTCDKAGDRGELRTSFEVR